MFYNDASVWPRHRQPDLVLITDKAKAMEDQCVRINDEWIRTFDAVPDLIMILDTEHRVVRINRSMAERLGSTPEKIIGLACHQTVHGTAAVPPFCPHAMLLKDGRTHQAEVFEERLRGYFLVSVSPIYSSDGKIIGSVHVARDITDRKRAEEALQRAQEELEGRVLERTSELVEANRRLRQEIEERKKAEEAFRASEERLRDLSSQLLSVQEQERKRIARELHDGLGQMLTAIKFKVENIAQKDRGRGAQRAERSLDPVVTLVQESLEEVRRVQMDLRPSMLDDLGVLATIGWFCRMFQTIYSAIRIDKKIDLSEEEISTPLKTVIYRVTQEALNNAAKHSRANRIRLFLRKVDGKIQLIIEDNGTGFDVEAARSVEASKRGFGLSGMRERVELSSGTFSIESHHGLGTTIRASWPAH